MGRVSARRDRAHGTSMSLADSQLEFDDLQPDGVAGPVEPRAGIFLNGDVVCCACPDCGSPMTIRIWLMAADCWVCGASVILTEEQQREVERLLQVVEARKSVEQQMPIPAPEPEKPAPPPEPKATPVVKPRPKPQPAPSVPVSAARAPS